MAKRQLGSPDPDLLAAVVLETLIEANGQPLTQEQVALACERQPSDAHESKEIRQAIQILVHDRLAAPVAGGFRATHAALRAAQLRF